MGDLTLQDSTGFCLFIANSTIGREYMDGWDWKHSPMSVLMSYAYPEAIKWFVDELQPTPKPVRFMLDSGAYTAFSVGKSISVDDYMRFISDYGKQYGITDVVSLDVIGDAKASYENAVIMADAGFDVIPVFHCGSELKWLHKLRERWNYIGIGRAGERRGTKLHWLYKSAFKACWPCKFHLFGCSNEPVLMEYPFYSADSSESVIASCKFGEVRSLGSQKRLGLSGATSRIAVKMDILHALKRERKVRDYWKLRGVRYE